MIRLALLVLVVFVLAGCNAHAFGGRAHLKMLNDTPLDARGRAATLRSDVSWDFVRSREVHTWESGETIVEVRQAIDAFEAASPSVVAMPTYRGKLSFSRERRTIVCIDPLVAVCTPQPRLVNPDSELRTTPVAFFRYGVGRLRLPQGYEAGTGVSVPLGTEWLVLHRDEFQRSPVRNGNGEIVPLKLPGLRLTLRPAAVGGFRVVGEPVESRAILGP